MIEQTIKKLSKDGILIMEYEEISGKGVKYRNRLPLFFNTGITTGKLVQLGYITLDAEGVLFIDAGYEWNGPNFIRDNAKAMKASMFHDALCELVAAGLLNFKFMPLINNLFERICKEDGMPKWKFKLYRWGLRAYWA